MYQSKDGDKTTEIRKGDRVFSFLFPPLTMTLHKGKVITFSYPKKKGRKEKKMCTKLEGDEVSFCAFMNCE